MSRGTPNSAKAPASITNAAGSSAAPEKYPPRDQRVSNTPGTRNKTRVPTSRTSGSAAKAAAPESATPASNHRRRAQALPTTPPPRIEDVAFAPAASAPRSWRLRRRGARTSRTFRSSRRSGRSSAFPLDRSGGTQHSTRTIAGLHSYIGLRSVHRDGRLKALSGCSRANGLELLWARAGNHLPAGYLRRSVPARIDSQLLVTGASLHCYGRIFIAGVSSPGEAEGPVGLDLGRESGVEEQIAISAELREGWFTAPTDEDVVVGQHLHVALGSSEQHVRVGVLAYHDGTHRLHVKLQHQTSGLLIHIHAAVIEDGYGAIRLAPSVVLPGPPAARIHLEVALLASQPPHHFAALAVDLVDRGGPAGGDEEVGVVVYVYGVEVEVVEGPLGTLRRRAVGLLDVHMLQAVPLEDDLPTLDLYLLGYPLAYRSILRSSYPGEVHDARLPIDRDERCVLIRY